MSGLTGNRIEKYGCTRQVSDFLVRLFGYLPENFLRCSRTVPIRMIVVCGPTACGIVVVETRSMEFRL